MIDAYTMSLLYTTYKHTLYKRAYRILRDHAAAEDAVQNVFVKLIKASDRLDIDALDSYKTRSLMMIVGDNVAKSMFQSKDRKLHISMEAGAMDLHLLCKEKGIAEHVIHKELSDKLNHALSLLDPCTADILRLRYLLDMRNVDIAILLGMSRLHVGMKVKRGVEKMGKLLKQNAM